MKALASRDGHCRFQSPVVQILLEYLKQLLLSALAGTRRHLRPVQRMCTTLLWQPVSRSADPP